MIRRRYWRRLPGRARYRWVDQRPVAIVADLKVGRHDLLKMRMPGQSVSAHEANFPVLGDAESVGACDGDDGHIAVHSGSIDTKDSQNKIVSIMEGGVEAFDRRKTIYQIWKAG